MDILTSRMGANKKIDLTTLSAVINGATKTVSNALLEMAVASLQSGGTSQLVTFEDVGGAFKRQASTTRFIMLKQDVNGVLVNYPAVASTANGVATNLSVCGVMKLNTLFFRCDVCISFGLNGDVGEILVIATPINT